MRYGSTPNAAAKAHALTRIAHVVGILLLGGVSWFLHRDPAWTPTEPTFPMRTVAMALWGAAIVGLLVLRYRWAGTRDPVERGRTAIIAMALAEIPAIFGGVIYFLTDDARLYISGLFLMMLSLIAFPIVQRR